MTFHLYTAAPVLVQELKLLDTPAGTKPITWFTGLRTKALDSIGLGESPSFRSLTIALTEVCNLDCWMCDFAVSKGLREVLPWQPEQYVEFLRHPVFKHLSGVGFTGGEPFAHNGIKDIYRSLIDNFPKLNIYFSSNATLYDRMAETLELTRNWRRTKLFTSIDGVKMHDVQRKVKGAFDKSMRTLTRLKEQFPQLHIDIKFTITPVNCSEIWAAFEYCTERNFNFTVKMVENNPYYTNRLSFEQHADDFRFDDAQIASIREQLQRMLTTNARAVSVARRHEIEEVLTSLQPDWRRSGRCLTPRRGSFLDSRLNFFTCKEYAPALNLAANTLDDLVRSPAYQSVIEAEKANTEACTRCTSQMKMPASGRLLL